MTAFSYPLTMPTSPQPSAAKWRLLRAQTESKSPFTFQTQTYDWGGEQWVCELTYPVMTLSQARSWVAFLLELQGKKGTFYFYPPETPVVGDGTGSPVMVSIISRNSVKISIAAANKTPWLAAGDYFSFANGELKRCLADANTNGSGQATVLFSPRYRQSPSVSSAISTETARGIFRLSQPTIEFDIQLMQHHQLRLVIEEAF